jgi:predicted ATPase/DNA-binding winged helix-turn-helix (wHTH) protein
VAPASPITAQIYTFEQFKLDLGSFSLHAGTDEISLEPQVMSLLTYLVQHCDSVVSRDELLDELWGHRYVSDSTVATQIKALRKALGDDGRNQRIIKTVHGRGYRLVSPVTRVRSVPQAAPVVTTNRTSNLGYERTKLIGRDADLKRCIEALDSYRLVSLLGIGGAGKTRLAKAVGRAVQPDYPAGVWFVDLVPVRDGAGIDTAIASAMGISVQAGEARSQIAQAVRERRVLFILDNCEHIEDEVAAALDYLLEHTLEPRFLVTSRDPIDLADELRFFIAPLPVHQDNGVAPAVELFILTAERHGIPGELLNTEQVQQICARLDGLPLAIELAAAQLKQLTIDELAERLDRRFELLAGRQREGSHRQDSLIRVVENTWQLLDAEEQRLLGQLAAFPGQFTVNDIEEVFAGELPHGISFAMSRLVELCLLSRTSRSGGWWRLLETVRLFVLEKQSLAEREQNRQRHAEWVLQKLGVYPEDQLYSFVQAHWSADHYSDLIAAELYFDSVGRRNDALEVCCGTGLMIQLDDGARANAKLQRIEHHLQDTTDVLALTKLHGTAALCAQVTRNPQRLAEEAEIYLTLARKVGDGRRLAGALALSSLNNNFVNPELAQQQLIEAVQTAEDSGQTLTRDQVLTYQIWSEAVTGKLDSAISRAQPIAARLLDAEHPLDNPTYNAACALIACLIFKDPRQALVWTNRLLERADAHSLWSATLLYASVFASTGNAQMAVQLMQDVEERLRRAGRSPWPDLLVPAIVLACCNGETEQATAWYSAIRASRKPQQMFHGIVVYRQLRTQLTPAEGDTMSLEEAGSAALKWSSSFG